MRKKVIYLPKQNPIKLKKNMQTDTRNAGNIRKGKKKKEKQINQRVGRY